ncbi:GntR family transcriptional regulator [Candidatus Frankia nodulisporulans]|uniref:GntR family transcriptional regulator n=1 Tax=Candidatus Frankia nodulisporulans TaxID=2060052 RepID=UPI001C2E8A99|nr:GntR family transcriptional regulator [Candidatus Frankia nodulisporulans]
MSLDSGSSKALYRQVADILRGSILRGDYGPGDPIPSESELMAAHSVSRTTARQAMALLGNEGLVVIGHGRRATVRPRPPVRRLARNRLSRAERDKTGGTFMADAAANNARPETKTTIVIEPADPETALLLGLEEGAPVLERRRQMSLDGRPTQLATSYLPGALVRGTQIERHDTGPGGIYARLEELGHTLTRFVEVVATRMPLPDEVDALQLPPGTPVFLVTRTAYDTEDRPVEVNRITMAGHLYELAYEIPAT